VLRTESIPPGRGKSSEVGMRRVLASVLLLAIAASAGCAARRPALTQSPTIWSGEEPAPGLSVVPAPPEDQELPKFGDFVYVEELPEAITKTAPLYPTLAREAGVEGTVIIQALVGRDGLVKNTRVVKSIPMLDAAAVVAVRQWVFKPARARNAPVAVWVATPVRFSLR
jgi:TonB family protein